MFCKINYLRTLLDIFSQQINLFVKNKCMNMDKEVHICGKFPRVFSTKYLIWLTLLKVGGDGKRSFLYNRNEFLCPIEPKANFIK